MSFKLIKKEDCSNNNNYEISQIKQIIRNHNENLNYFNNEIRKCEDILKKLKQKYDFKDTQISVGDVIVFESGRRLRLESIRFGDKQTLILINLETGSIYRMRNNNEFIHSESHYDLVLSYNNLVYRLHYIVSAFQLEMSKITSVEIRNNINMKIETTKGSYYGIY